MEKKESWFLKLKKVIGKILKKEDKKVDRKEISKKISQYEKEGNNKKAVKLGKKFNDDKVIQSQMIPIHLRNGKKEEALRIGEKFSDDRVIQSQIVKLFLEQGQIKEAMEIGKRFPNYFMIHNQIITKLIKEINDNPQDTKIQENIEQMEDKWAKVILYSALAEKTNSKSSAQKFIKDLKKSGKVDEEHRHLISSLEQRLQRKNSRIFDQGFYLRQFNELQNKKRTTPQNSER